MEAAPHVGGAAHTLPSLGRSIPATPDRSRPGASPVGGSRSAGEDGGTAPPDHAVCRVSPYRLRISLTGWYQVSPPPEQLPQPPEVTP